ncbi:MAG: type I restriction enzyme HsdR N-terminal domain-containing protein [Bacteroidales bacterium]|nr:type I restriction enzyme HsdR N-terminal domain-containing protein [Bacteroidales bacterium]
MQLLPLNLPSFPYKLKQINEKEYIFDHLRKQFVRLTPEEWVRQHFAWFLINYKNYPPGLMAIEYSFELNNQNMRADIVVFNNEGKILLVVECKAYNETINQQVFDQAFVYNLHLKAPYLIITNGLHHYCCKFDFSNVKEPFFLNEIPSFTSIK